MPRLVMVSAFLQDFYVSFSTKLTYFFFSICARPKFERRSLALSTEGSSEPRLCCSVCKEMLADEKALERHNEECIPPGRELNPKINGLFYFCL